MRDYYIEMANSYAKLAEINREIYEKWKRKEEKYDDIEGETGGMFEASAGLREAIREGLSDIAGAFQSGSYRPNMDAIWRRDIKTAQMVPAMKKELEQIGIEMDAERVRELLEMGYTVEEIKAYQLMCRTPEDKEFFIQILLGTEASYIRAFETNPNELSEGMTIFMSDYAVRLLELDENGNATKESAEKIMLFNNALLASERYCTDQEGNLLEIKYRDVYLEKIAVGTESLLLKDTITLAEMDKSDDLYQKLYTLYDKSCSMTLLWSTEMILLKQIESMGTDENRNYSISDLVFENKEAKFNLNHYSILHGAVMSDQIITDILEMDEWDAYLTDDRLKKLEEAKNQAIPNALLGITTDVMALLLGPGASGAVVNMTTAFMQGKAASISGVDRFVEQNAKTGFKLGNMVTVRTINEAFAYGNVVEALEKAEWEEYLEWFGKGGTYTVAYEDSRNCLPDEGISFGGNYDPDIVRAMGYWEKNGMAGWVNGFGDIEKVSSSLNTRGGDYQTYLEVLYGENVPAECPILKKASENPDLWQERETDDMTMEQFINAINNIQLHSEVNQLNIQNEFKNFVAAERGKK